MTCYASYALYGFDEHALQSEHAIRFIEQTCRGELIQLVSRATVLFACEIGHSPARRTLCAFKFWFKNGCRVPGVLTDTNTHSSRSQRLSQRHRLLRYAKL